MDLYIDSYHGPFMRKAEHHLYIAPADALKKVVAHYTITFPNKEYPVAEDSVLNLVPDVSGCFVVQFFDKLSVLVWGPTTKVAVVENDLNTAGCRFFVEFLPGGLYQSVGCPMKSMLDCRMELETFHQVLYEKIRQRMQYVTSFDEVVDIMNEILCEEIKKHPIPSSMQTCIERIHNGTYETAAQVSDDLHVSPRQVTRYFNRYVGMGVKKFTKIVKLNRHIQNLSDDNLIDLTYDYDYFDQAHFNHVFKEICDTTPTGYMANLSDFYNELYKF